MPILSFIFADGAPIPSGEYATMSTQATSTLSNDQFIGLLIVFGIIVLLFSLIEKSKTYKCRKCGFTTTDELRAAGHVATENKHACDEI